MAQTSTSMISARDAWMALGARLRGLAHRTLYHVIELCDDPPVPGKRYATAEGYRCVPDGDAQAVVAELFAKADEGPDTDFSRLYPSIEYQWFDPDPVGMPEPELDHLVQYRQMTPLTLILVNSKGHYQRRRIYVVPFSVLERPPNDDSRWSCHGEPWCHTCNPTFFWSGDVAEVPTYMAQGGRWCLQCRRSFPPG